MGRHISFKGSTIHHSIHGKGRAVVLLHGFTESLDIWKPFTRKLAYDHTVICVDLPGHGRSGVIGDVHTMDLMAEAVNAVIKEAGISQAVMVGHSMGGYVALAFAEKYPRKTRGLTLFHSHAAADSPEAMASRDRTIDIIDKDKKGFIQGFIPSLFDPRNVERFRQEISQLKVIAASMSKEAIIAALRGMKLRPDRTHVLANSDIPIQFIIGKNDTRIPMELVVPQTLLPSYSEVTILEGVGHMGFIEERQKTFHAVRSFAAGFSS